MANLEKSNPTHTGQISDNGRVATSIGHVGVPIYYWGKKRGDLAALKDMGISLHDRNRCVGFRAGAVVCMTTTGYWWEVSLPLSE